MQNDTQGCPMHAHIHNKRKEIGYSSIVCVHHAQSLGSISLNLNQKKNIHICLMDHIRHQMPNTYCHFICILLLQGTSITLEALFESVLLLFLLLPSDNFTRVMVLDPESPRQQMWGGGGAERDRVHRLGELRRSHPA